MSNKPPLCGVCGSLTKSFVCTSCLALVHQEKRSQLLQLKRKKDELLGKLTGIFEDRADRQAKKHERDQVLEALHRARAATQAATVQLERARTDVGVLSHANALRRTKLERLQSQIQSNRAELLNSYFPHLLRYQSLTYQHVSSMLLHEQKLKLKQVQDILPLKVEGMGGGTTPGEGSAILSICGVRVPDHMSNLLDGRHTPEATSAALGYTLLLLDLLGTYLGGPLLHEGSFQGSTTVLWQQQSFWNRRPGSSANVLPLYTEDIPQGGSLMPTLAAKSTGSSWSLGGLMRGGAAALDKAGGSSASASAVEELRQDSSEERSALQGSKYAELQAAHDMLQRSISCFVRDLIALAPGVQLPPSWSPVAWLVMLCALYHRDPRIEGLVQAAKTLTENSRGGALAAVSTSSSGLAVSGSVDSEAPPGSSPAGSGRPQEDGEEDWDVLLPPKPSESDSELELWTQAMMPQRVSQQQQAQRILMPLAAAAAAARNALGLPAGGVQGTFYHSNPDPQ